jgi:hypothetical protein
MAGTKHYAVRDESGRFNGIQTGKRGHVDDLRRPSKTEKEGAQDSIQKSATSAATAVVKSV